MEVTDFKYGIGFFFIGSNVTVGYLPFTYIYIVRLPYTVAKIINQYTEDLPNL